MPQPSKLTLWRARMRARVSIWLARHDQLTRSEALRRGHRPGWSDIGPVNSDPKGPPWFLAKPNFNYYEACGRPCWLPAYPAPRIAPGWSLTDGWPMEDWPSHEEHDFVAVVGQVHGEMLRSEHVLPDGSFEQSDIWNMVAIPTDRLVDPDTTAIGYKIGYMADLWLGNTGWHSSNRKSWQALPSDVDKALQALDQLCRDADGWV